jgi:hypothetical protein
MLPNLMRGAYGNLDADDSFGWKYVKNGCI